MNRRLRAIVIFGSLALAIGWAVYSSYLKYTLYLPEVGDKVPGFELRSLSGSGVSLQDLLNTYEGVVINFFATWCPPCIDEMPSLVRFGKFLKEKNVILVIIAGDSPEKEVREIVQKFKVSFPVLLDETGKVGEKYGITGYPETFVVNKQGILMQKFVGPRDWDKPEIRNSVLKALFHFGGKVGGE